jgi:hypothetical protein
MTAQLYAGVYQFDNWAITVSGRTFRCYVWVDDGRRTVESRCMVVTDGGAEVELFRRTVYSVTSDFGPDCPKIIASGSTLLVDFFEGDINPGSFVAENPRIRRVTLDMSGFESAQWTDRGTFSVGRFMHDLRPVLEHASDFIIAYVDTDDIPHMRRFDGLDWIDIAWTADAAHEVAVRALSCYAHDADNDAIMVYERNGAEALHTWVTRADADDGTNTATGRVLAGFPDGYLWQARFCRYASGRVNLVAECSEAEVSPDFAIPSLVYQRIDSGTALTLSLTQWAHHLRMLGEPFSYAGSRETDVEPNCYVLAGYGNTGVDTAAEHEFTQRSAFVVELFATEWENADAAQEIRPRPMWVGNFGDFDCRVSGSSPDGDLITGYSLGRRIGHVSSASAAHVRGPALKTRTWSVLGFGKLMAISPAAGESPLQPVHATGLAVRFQVEEPTQAFRDGSDPATPDACYHGVNRFTVGDAREAAGGAVIGGGCMAYYDHHRVFELGYCWHPQILRVEELEAGDIADGTYLYTATFEQRDALGQLHRSAPALPVSYTADAGGEVIQALVNSQTLSLRDNAYVYPGCSPINTVLWRTEAGGTVFYRVNASGSGSNNRPRDTDENNPAVGFSACQDNVSDASLVEHETLPFALIDGAWAPLPPFQPPAGSCIEKWQNRIFIASSQDTRIIFYSQEMLLEPGGSRTLPPEFHPNLVVRVDGIGPVIAMHARDEELLVLTSDATYSITGIGADGAGNDASYQISLVAKHAGTIDSRSVVGTPAGVFAQTRHGLYCLTTGGGLEYIQLGAKVADVIRSGGNLRAATYLADRAAVRWVTNAAVEGEPLAVELDLLGMRWSVHPLAAGDLPAGSDALSSAVGGCSWIGDGGHEHHVVIEQGAALVERTPDDDEPYADENRAGSLPVPLRVRLRPVHLDGINGFVSLRRVALALEKPDDSAYRITHYAWRSGRYEDVVGEIRDYESPAPERHRPYGPRQQRCAAFWIDFQELASPEVPATENVRILGLQIEVGTMRGLRKD